VLWSIKFPKTVRQIFLFFVLLLSFSCHLFAAEDEKDVAYLQQMLDSVIAYSDRPQMFTHLNKMYKVALKQQNDKYIGYYYHYLTVYYYNKLNLDSVLNIFNNHAKAFFIKTKNYRYLFDTQAEIINLYSWRGDYETAAALGLQMYNESNKLNFSSGRVAACSCLGYTYSVTQNHNEAIKWLKRALPESFMVEHPFKKLSILTSLFDTYKETAAYDSAKNCLNEIENIILFYNSHPKEIQKEKFSSNTVNSIRLWVESGAAELAIKQNNLPLAKRHLDKARAYYDQHLSTNFDIMYFITYINYYDQTKEYDKAMSYLNKADSLTKTFTGYDLLLMKIRADLNYKMKNYPESTRLYKQLIQKNDSDTNEEIKNQNVWLSSVYNVDKIKAEGKQTRWNIILQIVIIVSLLILVLLSFIVVHRSYKDKKITRNAMLEAKKADEQTSKFLHHMNDELKKQLDGISAITERLSVETDVTVRKQYSAEIKKTNELLQYVIFNVLDVSKIESGRMKLLYNNESLPGIFQEIIHDTANMFSSQMKLRVIECPALFIKTDRFRLKQILNSVIHYFASRTKMGDISFRCIETKDKLEFTVFDDGYIMNVTEARRIFDRSAQTMVELKDMGLDMIISKQIVQQMNGNAWIDSDESGTTFYFDLPLEIVDEEEEKL